MGLFRSSRQFESVLLERVFFDSFFACKRGLIANMNYVVSVSKEIISTILQGELVSKLVYAVLSVINVCSTFGNHYKYC